MPRERIINEKRCRVYSSGYTWIWVADTGDFVSHYEKGGRYKGSCRILKCHRGPFVRGTYSGMVYLDKAVITCFCPPCPKDGKRYMINHKDGNWMNCNYRNLEWAPYHYRNTTVPKVRLYHCGDFLEVFSDGTVKNNGQEISVLNYFYDSDVDCIWATSDPFIKIDRNDWYHMDDVMKDAGYVHGDDANLKNPGILHKDGDYMNFASDNLEWVEKDDQHYIDYLEKREKDRKARLKELNGDKQLPPSWE